jgi:hypothetical protein
MPFATSFGVNSKHNCESGQARCYLHLHVDAAGFDPLKGYRSSEKKAIVKPILQIYL